MDRPLRGEPRGEPRGLRDPRRLGVPRRECLPEGSQMGPCQGISPKPYDGVCFSLCSPTFRPACLIWTSRHGFWGRFFNCRSGISREREGSVGGRG